MADDGCVGVAVRAWEPQTRGELRLDVGQHVVVIAEAAGGWYDGMNASGMRGYFPIGCVDLSGSGFRSARARRSLLETAVAVQIAPSVASAYGARAASAYANSSGRGTVLGAKRYDVQWEGKLQVPAGGFAANEMIELASPSGDRVIIAVPQSARAGAHLQFSIAPDGATPPRCTVLPAAPDERKEVLAVDWSQQATVRVPEGGWAGATTVEVTSPSGKSFNYEVGPEGLRAGQELHLELAADAAPDAKPNVTVTKVEHVKSPAEIAEERRVADEEAARVRGGDAAATPLTVEKLARQLRRLGGVDVAKLEYAIHKLTNNESATSVTKDGFVAAMVAEYAAKIRENGNTSTDHLLVREIWSNVYDKVVTYEKVVSYDALWWPCVALAVASTDQAKRNAAVKYVTDHFTASPGTGRQDGAIKIVWFHMALTTSPFIAIELAGETLPDISVSPPAKISPALQAYVDKISPGSGFGTWLIRTGGAPTPLMAAMNKVNGLADGSTEQIKAMKEVHVAMVQSATVMMLAAAKLTDGSPEQVKAMRKAQEMIPVTSANVPSKAAVMLEAAAKVLESDERKKQVKLTMKQMKEEVEQAKSGKSQAVIMMEKAAKLGEGDEREKQLKLAREKLDDTVPAQEKKTDDAVPVKKEPVPTEETKEEKKATKTQTEEEEAAAKKEPVPMKEKKKEKKKKKKTPRVQAEEEVTPTKVKATSMTLDSLVSGKTPTSIVFTQTLATPLAKDDTITITLTGDFGFAVTAAGGAAAPVVTCDCALVDGGTAPTMTVEVKPKGKRLKFTAATAIAADQEFTITCTGDAAFVKNGASGTTVAGNIMTLKDKAPVDFLSATITEDPMKILKTEWLAKVEKKGMDLSSNFLELAPGPIKKDEDVVTAAVQKNGMALQFADAKLRDKHDVVHDAVHQNGMALQHVGLSMQKDYDVVHDACHQNGQALAIAGTKLNFKLHELVHIDYPTGEIIAITDDLAINILYEAVESDPAALEHAIKFKNADGEEYASKPGMKLAVQNAVGKDGLLLKFAGSTWQGDKEVVTAAVKKNGMALEFASPELKKDKSVDGVVDTAVEENGMALQFADVDVKNDPEVVLYAVESKGMALMYAGAAAKSDYEVVLAAVKHSGMALQFLLNADKTKLDLDNLETDLGERPPSKEHQKALVAEAVTQIIKNTDPTEPGDWKETLGKLVSAIRIFQFADLEANLLILEVKANS